MSLILGDNFSYQGSKPLDARLKYDTLADMKAVADATMYEGCLAYCVAVGKTYQWKSTNTVDESTGKWREFTSGGSGETYTAGDGILINNGVISVKTNIFTGTEEEWDALTAEEQAAYQLVSFRGDGEDITLVDNILHDLGAGYAGGQNKKFNCGHGIYYDNDNKLLYFYSVNPFGSSATTLFLLEWDMSNPYKPIVKRTLDLNSVVTFQHGSLNVTSIDKYDKYLYIATRSTDGGAPSDGYDNSSIWGALIIVDTTDFTIAKTETFNGKCSCVNVFKSSSGTIYMVVNVQMSYMKVYTLNPSDLTDFTLHDTQYFMGYNTVQGWTDYNPKIQEQQQGQIFETPDNKVLFATAGFADGVRIWDITNITTTRATLYNWYSGDHADMWKSDNINLYHAFAVTVNYPYAYFSLGAGTSVANSDHNNGTNNRRMGVLTLDFSDLSNLVVSIQNIAIADMNDFVSANQADPSPTNILQVNDKLFLGNGDKGVAIFDVSTPSTPVYVGNKAIPNIQIVGAMCKTELGSLLIGDQIIITINPDKGYSRKKYIKMYGIQ